ncbi:MAG: anaerobic glycerol-3-phosphate dehydrogenase subunit B [Bacteroidales bacterium]|nr:anaerobic glycerol-3-phosphate dehydrogenase subunit B [Bacteroidales bacterium]
MKFDTVIIGGGLAGLTAGICLQKARRTTAVISTGQSALHFFSGAFETLGNDARTIELFGEAGIRLHYREGWRLMPLGSFREATLSLEDIRFFEERKVGRKALILNFLGYSDFFPEFIAEGLRSTGTACRTGILRIPEVEVLRLSPSEVRSVHIARAMDKVWEKVVQEIRLLHRDEDVIILPQVFGLSDPTVPGQLQGAVPAKVIFAGTLPPSVPGIRTQWQLRRRYEVLGGTFLLGDEAREAVFDGPVLKQILTRNLGAHPLEADHFILASGSFFSKGLSSSPTGIREPLFGLDVSAPSDRNAWYDADFHADQPYMGFGVLTDSRLHALKDGRPLPNLFAAGSILGATRPELGSGAGLAIRSAFAITDFLTA